MKELKKKKEKKKGYVLQKQKEKKCFRLKMIFVFFFLKER